MVSNCNILSWIQISQILLQINYFVFRYFAAPGQINNSNIYNDTSPYEEIDDDYLVPEASESHETSVKDETEPSPEDVDHYLELEWKDFNY